MLGDTIFQLLLDLFTSLTQFIIDLVIDPIFNMVLKILPGFSNYTDTALDFINDYFIRGILFAKGVFLEVTHFPPILFNYLIIFCSGLFILFVATLGIRFALNALSLLRAGRSATTAMGGKSK